MIICERAKCEVCEWIVIMVQIKVHWQYAGVYNITSVRLSIM